MAFNMLSLLFLKFRGRSVAVFRDHCTHYEVSHPCIHSVVFRAASLIAPLAQGVLAVAQRHFRSLQDVRVEDVVLLAVIPGYPDQAQVELSKEIWSTVSAVVHTVMIALESGAFPMTFCRRCGRDGHLTETFLFLMLPQKCGPQTSPAHLSCLVTRNHASDLAPRDLLSSHHRLSLRSACLHRQAPISCEHRSESSSNNRAKIMLTAHPRQPMPNTSPPAAPKKPVIYLYPPSSLPDVTIELQLTSSWHFSAVYPLPQTAIPSYGPQPTQSLTWAIAAEPNGTLVEKTTSTEVSYLYWEAM